MGLLYSRAIKNQAPCSSVGEGLQTGRLKPKSDSEVLLCQHSFEHFLMSGCDSFTCQFS